MTTVVLGLDGAGFELLDPWLDDGTLPSLARVVEEGAATDMQSCVPPVTCPNWQCYATGRNPGKLGVFWWERVDAADRRIETTSRSDQFDGTHYWRYLPGSAAVVNLPTSYPPPAIDGVHVAGGPGAEQTGYTNPPEFEDRLERDHDYVVHPEGLGELSSATTDADAVDAILDVIDTRFDVLESVLADGDHELVHLTVFYVNVLHHFFWDDEGTREAWRRIDDRLRELLASDDVDRLFLMSDHGSNEVDVTFMVNQWLAREGYLVTERGVGDLLHRAGITRSRVRRALSTFGVERALRRLVPRRLQTALPDDEGRVTEGAKAGVVDWEASTALASGQGPLYVLADDPEERRRVREELIEKLDGLTHEGRTVVERAMPAEDVYHGPHVERGPDVLLRQAPGVHIRDSLGGDGDPFEAPDRWRGENTETGVFAAWGPDVDPDAALDDMHILDVAPTVLHRHGVAVPDDHDGAVRTDLWLEGSEPASRAVERQPATDDDGPADGVETDADERLRDLGYLQ